MEEEVPSGGKGTKIQKATADCRVLALVPQIQFHYCLRGSGFTVGAAPCAACAAAAARSKRRYAASNLTARAARQAAAARIGAGRKRAAPDVARAHCGQHSATGSRFISACDSRTSMKRVRLSRHQTCNEPTLPCRDVRTPNHITALEDVIEVLFLITHAVFRSGVKVFVDFIQKMRRKKTKKTKKLRAAAACECRCRGVLSH